MRGGGKKDRMFFGGGKTQKYIPIEKNTEIVEMSCMLNLRADLGEFSASYRLSRGNSRRVNIISVAYMTGLNQY